MKRRIEKRIFSAIDIELTAPLSISDGIQLAETRKRFVADEAGHPYIPGSTIAGALYRSIDGLEDLRKRNALWAYDSRFQDADKVARYVRYDSSIKGEVVPTGARATVFLQLIIRSGCTGAQEKMDRILQAMQDGQVALGAERSRGYGTFCVLNVRSRAFSRENVGEWLSFKRTQLDCYEQVEEPFFTEGARDETKQR